MQDHLNSVLQRSSNIVLNLGAVDFLDSGGLGLLVRFYNRTQTAQGSLKLCGVPANIAEVLRITKLNTLLESYDTEEAAITASYHRAASPRPEFRFDADILCVDSSADVVAYARELLKQAGYGVVTAENAPDALTLLRAAQPKLVIVGAQLRGTRSTRTTETLNRLGRRNRRRRVARGLLHPGRRRSRRAPDCRGPCPTRAGESVSPRVYSRHAHADRPVPIVDGVLHPVRRIGGRAELDRAGGLEERRHPAAARGHLPRATVGRRSRPRGMRGVLLWRRSGRKRAGQHRPMERAVSRARRKDVGGACRHADDSRAHRHDHRHVGRVPRGSAVPSPQGRSSPSIDCSAQSSRGRAGTCS